MTARDQSAESVAGAQTHRQRFQRYAPLMLWIAWIFFASTGELSASETSRIVGPLLLWLFPDISEERMMLTHFVVRKVAHFAEYAVLGFLAARAFVGSSQDWLRRGWLVASLVLVVLAALSDEFHQSYVPSRTGTIYDVFIDAAGGLTALALYAGWHKRKRAITKLR